MYIHTYLYIYIYIYIQKIHVHEHAQVVLPLWCRWSPTSGPFCLTSAAVDVAMAQLAPVGAIGLVYLKYQIPLHDITAELSDTHKHMDHTWRWKADGVVVKVGFVPLPLSR